MKNHHSITHESYLVSNVMIQRDSQQVWTANHSAKHLCSNQYPFNALLLEIRWIAMVLYGSVAEKIKREAKWNKLITSFVSAILIRGSYRCAIWWKCKLLKNLSLIFYSTLFWAKIYFILAIIISNLMHL